MARAVLIAAVVTAPAPAAAEPRAIDGEVVLGVGSALGLTESDPLGSRGLGIRALLPRRPGRALELALDWRRLSGADVADSDFTTIDDERYDRVRATAGLRFRPAHRRAGGHARVAAGLELAHGTVTMQHRSQDGEPSTYETRRGFVPGAVVAAGAGFSAPIGPVSLGVELELAVGWVHGVELSYDHHGKGPFAEGQLLLVIGTAR